MITTEEETAESAEREVAMKAKAYIRQHGVLLLILGIAVLTRWVGLGKIPGGILPDEAYGAYNAWALLNEGIDSRGYGFPVYFVAWGSGMNALYSYLAIPLFRLFGATMTVYRIPQALFGTLGVYAAYVLGRELYNETFGLVFSFVLAINPWNIMNNRFALESNLAPSVFLIAVTLLVLGMKKKATYLPFAALFFGATLYAYAQSWIVVPLFLILFLIVYRKSIPFGKYLWIAVTILFLMACPLLYFVGVNLGFLPEIKTAFFSIPRLLSFRGEELNLANILSGAATLAKVLVQQYDGVSYTACKETGAYYYFTAPFCILGILVQVTDFFRNRKGERTLEYTMLLWLLSAGIMSVLNETITIIHVNLIHIPVIFYGAYGIYKVCEKLKNRVFSVACLAVLCVSFGIFLRNYVEENKVASYFCGTEAQDAIAMAREVSANNEFTIVKPQTINFAVILWNEKIPVKDFMDTVVYTGDIGWESTERFCDFRYVYAIQDAVEDGVYLIPHGYEEEMMHREYDVITVNDSYSLAVRQP